MINVNILKDVLLMNDLGVFVDKEQGSIAIELYNSNGGTHVVSAEYDKFDPSTILPAIKTALDGMGKADKKAFAADANKLIECIEQVSEQSYTFKDYKEIGVISVDIIGIDSRNKIFGTVTLGNEVLDFDFDPKDDNFIVPNKGNTDVLSDNLDELAEFVTEEVKASEIYAKWPNSKPLTINDLPKSLANMIANAQAEVADNNQTKGSPIKDER